MKNLFKKNYFIFSIILALISNIIGVACANEKHKVDKRDIEIPFITKSGAIDRRTVRVVIPETAEKPVPLVFFAHYPIGEDHPAFAEIINKGWALAILADFEPFKHSAALIDDNLVFNSAALSAVCKLPEIDRTRIAVIGESAGGYISLMLTTLHLGICTSVSVVGVANIRFNMIDYFDHVQSYNLKAVEKLNAKDRGNMQRRLEAMPMPVLGSLYDAFIPVKDNFPDKNDVDRWVAFSPAAMTSSFSNPILFTHFTSDLLVPIDQITKNFTYDRGETLPDDFKLRLSEFDIPEILQRSLAETIPAEDLSERVVPAPEKFTILDPEFDANKRFNIFVVDEGPVEAKAGHLKDASFYISYITYFETQFALSSRKTNRLTVEKLVLLAERYAGKCAPLPARVTADETIYGSAAKYRGNVL